MEEELPEQGDLCLEPQGDQGEGDGGFVGIATGVIGVCPIHAHGSNFLKSYHSITLYNFLHRDLTFLLSIPIRDILLSYYMVS